MATESLTDIFSPAQVTALYIVVIPSKLLSALGSSLIVQHILRYMLGGKVKTTSYHRLLFGLSLYDVAASVTMLISPFLPDKLIAGSPACTATGFVFVYTIFSSILYNVSLSIYFLLIVRYQIKETTLASCFEPLCHVFIVGVMGAVFAAGIPLEIYNPLFGGTCWAAAYPPGCATSDDGSSCTRGGTAGRIYGEGLHIAYILLFCTLLIANFMIYWTVRQTEKRTDRYNANETQSQSRLAAIQSMLFCGAFFTTYTPSIILQLLPKSAEWWYYMMLILAGLTLPLQGYVLYI